MSDAIGTPPSIPEKPGTSPTPPNEISDIPRRKLLGHAEGNEAMVAKAKARSRDRARSPERRHRSKTPSPERTSASDVGEDVLSPSFSPDGIPSFTEEIIDVSIIRSWFPVAPESLPRSGQVTLLTTDLAKNDEFPRRTLSFCRHFFIVRDKKTKELLQAKSYDVQKLYSVHPEFSELGRDKARQRPLREVMKCTMDTSRVLINSELRQNATANAVLRKLREEFKEIPSFNAETAEPEDPSHWWADPENMLTPSLLAHLCGDAETILRKEPTLLSHKPPVYVIGDLHGNYKDLMYFVKSFGLWIGADWVPATFLFLGDYVDRGPHSIETVSYLLALKLRCPDKVYLLRGNHETSAINGDMDMYREGSFRYQLMATYGTEDGQELWLRFNRVFDLMPLCAVIDKKVFCVHAGIPRHVASYPDILVSLGKIRRPPDVNDELILDLLWSDPATVVEEQAIARGEPGYGPPDFPEGFGTNCRGSTCAIFGKAGSRIFFKSSGCSHIIRAHQFPSHGIDLAKSGTVLTVFSSSHYCGFENLSAAVLVNNQRLFTIISKPEPTAEPEVIVPGDSKYEDDD